MIGAQGLTVRDGVKRIKIMPLGKAAVDRRSGGLLGKRLGDNFNGAPSCQSLRGLHKLIHTHSSDLRERAAVQHGEASTAYLVKHFSRPRTAARSLRYAGIAGD